MPNTVYRSPLIPVKPRAQAFRWDGCNAKVDKVPYSKSTAPHFLEESNEDKYIVKGKQFNLNL